MLVTFEFDPFKSASNKAKHGIDFVEAQALWLAWVAEAPAKTEAGQVRYAVIGTITKVHYTAIITYRGNVRRIISVRLSTEIEVAHYERKKPNP